MSGTAPVNDGDPIDHRLPAVARSTINPDYQAVEHICQNCGKVTRYGYRKEKGEDSPKLALEDEPQN